MIRNGAQERESSSKAAMKPLLPGATIGVLGGGQLGRMMALAGIAMGYRFVTLDPAADAPCAQAAQHIRAPYDDLAAAEELAKRSDVITYEFENVSLDVVQVLEREAYVPQGSRLLQTTKHRLREKGALTAAGIPVAPYAAIHSLDDLEQHLAAVGGQGVLKTCTGGYDGKGQYMIRRPEEAREAYETLASTGAELVLEAYIPFVKELSVIAARNPNGDIATFPVAENIHRDHILHLSIVPARIATHVLEEAKRIAHRIAESLEVVGLIAVEMFLTEDEQLLVNELAPRPHNSGHYTIDACRTSQFEQHLQAICNLPLGDTSLMTPVVMVNLLGEHQSDMLQWLASEDSTAKSLGVTPKLHDYGKSEALPKRKMGHINVLAPDVESALAWVKQTNIWRNQQQ
ncbi:5-(carboxyamino)imidazole ribonucleotide synthase [Paenibacillus marinisediminis]